MDDIKYKEGLHLLLGWHKRQKAALEIFGESSESVLHENCCIILEEVLRRLEESADKEEPK